MAQILLAILILGTCSRVGVEHITRREHPRQHLFERFVFLPTLLYIVRFSGRRKAFITIFSPTLGEALLKFDTVSFSTDETVY